MPSQDSVNCILAGKELSLHPPSAFHAKKQSRSLSPVKKFRNVNPWLRQVLPGCSENKSERGRLK